MNTTFSSQSHFDQQYQTHLKHLKLKGLQPKTIEAYSRTIRRIGARFDHQIDSLTEAQLTDYFLWRVLQHVLPKGFRRVRNFGFLHTNCKRLIALLHLVLKFAPGRASDWIKERAPILCTCCGAVMKIVRTRIRSSFSGGMSAPYAAQGTC